jgi:hypothetical protein
MVLPTAPTAPLAAPAAPARAATTTFVTSKTFLPAAAIKTLRAQAPPLADEAVPEPRCLRSFWERAYAAIQSLDETFADFGTRATAEHVATFGPVLLGVLAWQ